MAANGGPQPPGANRIPGLAPSDPSIAASIERTTLLERPDAVAQVLVMLGERMGRQPWDLIMIAIPAGKADAVMDAVGLS